MPKHGWKWRTEQVRKLTAEQLQPILQYSQVYRLSSRMARWIYEDLIPEPDELGLRIYALDRLGFDSETSWTRPYLWRELEKYKHEPFGDWCVIALSRSCAGDELSAKRFIALYEDETAHPDARGSAVFGIHSAMSYDDGFSKPFAAGTLEAVRSTCAKALVDKDNAYARAGACWLAQDLGGFEKELAVLAEDHAVVLTGNPPITVADHVDKY
jgi:hypothetical protein